MTVDEYIKAYGVSFQATEAARQIYKIVAGDDDFYTLTRCDEPNDNSHADIDWILDLIIHAEKCAVERAVKKR